MKVDLTGVEGIPLDAEHLQSAQFGAMCAIASRSKAYAAMPLQAFAHRLRMPIKLGQCRVFFNALGQCMGFVTWAFLHQAVEERILRSGHLKLHEFEWNEGPSVWIIDMVINGNALKPVMRELRDSTFRGAATLTYRRLKPAGPCFKRLSRQSVSSFWQLVPDWQPGEGFR